MPIGLPHPAIGASSAQPTMFQRRVRFQRDPKGVWEIQNCMDVRRAQRGEQVQQQVAASYFVRLAQEHGVRSSINTKPVDTTALHLFGSLLLTVTGIKSATFLIAAYAR